MPFVAPARSRPLWSRVHALRGPAVTVCGPLTVLRGPAATFNGPVVAFVAPRDLPFVAPDRSRPS
eukprot:6177052-Pyramimonas_sp.AAC.1